MTLVRVPHVLAIDPGPTFSAYAFLFRDGDVLGHKQPNAEVRQIVLGQWYDEIVIEMVSHYGAGMPAGSEVFDTCRWIGTYEECARQRGKTAKLILRRDVKINLCGAVTAKDKNVRQAVIDRYGGDSVALAGKRCSGCHEGMTKAGKPHAKCSATGWSVQRGPLYDVRADVWQALAVALTFLDKKKAA